MLQEIYVETLINEGPFIHLQILKNSKNTKPFITILILSMLNSDFFLDSQPFIKQLLLRKQKSIILQPSRILPSDWIECIRLYSFDIPHKERIEGPRV